MGGAASRDTPGSRLRAASRKAAGAGAFPEYSARTDPSARSTGIESEGFPILSLSALPVILLYLSMSKQFIRGLTAGAVKG